MYFARIMWWDELSEKDEATNMFICADSYENATRYIMEDFGYVESISIEQLDSEERHIIYVPEEVAQQVKEENLY